MLERSLAEIAATLAAWLPPPSPTVAPEWIGWLTDGELTWLEEIYRRWEHDGVEPTKAEELQAVSIAGLATARMVGGEAIAVPTDHAGSSLNRTMA
jgi:hypothetical protein